ncbi:PTS sugar transporter subunit IIA [Thermoanaerobacterium thermosaccharolyticum]|uniref:PTS sugar transporter subunit IIA n=1 Tax=Thermoanaerobacterium thermosaccharolyticum TaxID=1517 RepID=UPI0016803993|nr:PTS mannose transporter subunit IIAB [Thermoanaerobacterium thermosaccharolyticum]
MRLYIASHEKYALGIIEALNLLIGRSVKITPICAYDKTLPDEKSVEEIFASTVDLSISKNEKIIIFTDLIGGSVTNTAIKYMKRDERVHVIAGFNLSLLLEFILACESGLSVENAIAKSILAGKNGIVYINELY